MVLSAAGVGGDQRRFRSDSKYVSLYARSFQCLPEQGYAMATSSNTAHLRYIHDFLRSMLHLI